MSQPRSIGRAPAAWLLALLVSAFVAAGAWSGIRPLLPEGIAALPGEMTPLVFVENRGQVDGPARFYLHQPAASVFFAPGALVVDLRVDAGDEIRSHAYRVELAGAGPAAPVESVERSAGLLNIFQGNDPGRWLTNVPTHEHIAYLQPWPGIDVHYRVQHGRLESAYIVAAGAGPDAIRLRYAGQDGLSLDRRGNLVVRTSVGAVIETAPVLYQQSRGHRTYIAGRYVLLDQETVGFETGAYDRALPLVIDPYLTFSTYLGGTGSDQGNAVALDGAGNAYVAGLTTSTNFPTVLGSYRTSNGGNRDAFVTKLSPAGSLVYSTYLGGSGLDEAAGIDVDTSGNAYVAGVTASTNFPTLGPYQQFRGGLDDAFVTKLNAAGSALVFSTYLGGADDDEAHAIAIDAANNIYLTGVTFSSPGAFPNFPVLNAFDATLEDFDAFVTKLNSAGNTLGYSTYLGGTGLDEGFGIAVDAAGSAYVTGQTFATNFPTASPYRATSGGGRDGFVTKLGVAGSTLVYSTYLGGSGSDYGTGIAINSANNAFVAGLTASTNFPVVAALQGSNAGSDDAFITKFNASGSAPAYSTYLGGTGGDGAGAIALDGSSNAYLTGSTFSTNFPTVSPIFGAAGGGSDGFVTMVNSAGSALSYSTYLGGSNSNDRGWGIAATAAGDALITGSTFSTNFPTAAPYQAAYAGLGDGFVTRITQSGGSVGGFARSPEVASPPGDPTRPWAFRGQPAAIVALGAAAAAFAIAGVWYGRRRSAR